MTVWNTRNAGRKPSISNEELEDIRIKREQGISVIKLAEEYGVSRQTMSAYLNQPNRQDNKELIYKTYKKWVEVNKDFRKAFQMQDYLLRMEFMCEDELCSSILVNFKKKEMVEEVKKWNLPYPKEIEQRVTEILGGQARKYLYMME